MAEKEETSKKKKLRKKKTYAISEFENLFLNRRTTRIRMLRKGESLQKQKKGDKIGPNSR